MGEVYRARDTRLDRTVAIKVLPDVLATDRQLRERFDREARAISQLDHPHICTVHDVGEHDGIAYLVMQYLEGDTLDSRLKRGRLDVREALRIGIELADALDRAHRAGIVHRDLKPSNVMLTRSGAKLLDFGLARTGASLLAGAAATLAPTTPAGLTQQGSILGTLQYMAPEQLEAREADARSDIFAFGAVLYEMLTGAKAFSGKSQASLVGAILKDTPAPISNVQPLVPSRLEAVVMTCLEKDPDDRWQSMRDVRRELEWLVSSRPESPGLAERPRITMLPWLVAGLTVVGAVAAVAWTREHQPTAPPPTRLAAALPPNAIYRPGAAPSRGLAVSPDGRTLVFTGGANAATRALYKRALDRLTVDPIAGTEGALQPFFSPDGQWVAFFTFAGELKKIALGGGPSVTLVRGLQNGQWSFGSWRRDDVIVFSAFENLLQVPAAGGSPVALTQLSGGGTTDLWHQYPVVVPSTGDIVFTVYTAQARRRLELLRWGSRQRSVLVEDATGAVITPSGQLVFTRDGIVMAAAFDAGSGQVGGAVPLPESVVVDQQGIAQLNVSADGTLVYVPADPEAPPSVLGWTSRTGDFSEIAPLPTGTNSVAMSPDDKLAVLSGYGTSKVSIFDLARKVSTPLDLRGRQVESVTWHPDGKRVTLGGAYLSLLDPDTLTETRLTPIGRPKRFPSWTADGLHVAYMTFEPSNDIYMVSLKPGAKEVDGDPRPLIATVAAEGDPAIAPNGHWIAYRSRSDRSNGRNDVYIARFPDGTGRVQVTSNGGGTPFWSAKGDELFFGAPPGVLQVARVSFGDRADVGTVQTLFPLGDYDSLSVSSDGNRFLAIKTPPTGPPRQLVVVQNWLSELTRTVPAR
jgi:serine/threonine-protein kinase